MVSCWWFYFVIFSFFFSFFILLIFFGGVGGSLALHFFVYLNFFFFLFLFKFFLDCFVFLASFGFFTVYILFLVFLVFSSSFLISLPLPCMGEPRPNLVQEVGRSSLGRSLLWHTYMKLQASHWINLLCTLVCLKKEREVYTTS